jgi:hypothetical protein
LIWTAIASRRIYGIGIKELWDIDPENHVPGRVIHTQGWPLSETGSNGGGFLYHQANNQVALGFVTWLNYKPTRMFLRSRNCSAGSSTRKSARFWKAAAGVLWRAGDQRWRLAGRAQAGLPRRRADRLFGRLRQRAAHQGQPHRDEERHAGRRGCRRRDRRGPWNRIRWANTMPPCATAGSPRN